MSVSLYTVHIILKTESKILGRDFDFRQCIRFKVKWLDFLCFFSSAFTNNDLHGTFHGDMLFRGHHFRSCTENEYYVLMSKKNYNLTLGGLYGFPALTIDRVGQVLGGYIDA